ncbi:MAG TPA: hypothetical protein VMW38_21375 [Terriglobia bacterium]|nr:hypothetical protein [Terriglobia bacterium]
MKEEPPNGSPATQLVKLVTHGASAEVFHTPDGDPFVVVPVGGHREVLHLGQTEFTAKIKPRHVEPSGEEIHANG